MFIFANGITNLSGYLQPEISIELWYCFTLRTMNSLYIVKILNAYCCNVWSIKSILVDV